MSRYRHFREAPAAPRFDKDGWLYHVTYAGRLYNIEQEGLCPGASSAVGIGGYRSHSEGRLFLTAADGVFFWFGRYEAFAEHNSDNPLEDELVPVVLRVDAQSAYDSGIDFHLDEPGTRDARADAYYVTKCLHPDDVAIELYDGKTWVPLEDGLARELEVAFNIELDDSDCQQDEEGGEDEWSEPEDCEPVETVSFKQESPFFPPELHP